MIEQPPPPNLHTTYLSKSQLKTCNKNPTYRTRLSELQALHSELQRILNILTERTTGKLPSPKPSLRKRLSLNRGQTTALKLQLQLSDREDDAFVQRVRAEYLAQEKRLCEWDDQCAALAESLLSKPRVSLVTLSPSNVLLLRLMYAASSKSAMGWCSLMDVGFGPYPQGMLSAHETRAHKADSMM